MRNFYQFSTAILGMLLLMSSQIYGQKSKTNRVYYPALKVIYNNQDPIIVNVDGTMYNTPSRSVQIDKISSGRHLITIYRVKIKKNGKRKYYELFNGRINIRPERINLAQVYNNGTLRVRYLDVNEDMAYVDKNRSPAKKIRRVEIIKPVYKEAYNDSSTKFMTLLNKVDEVDYETNKIAEIKKYLLEAQGISVKQIYILSESFVFDSSRMELVEATHKYIIDKENYDYLENIFESDDNKRKFRETIFY